MKARRCCRRKRVGVARYKCPPLTLPCAWIGSQNFRSRDASRLIFSRSRTPSPDGRVPSIPGSDSDDEPGLPLSSPTLATPPSALVSTDMVDRLVPLAVEASVRFDDSSSALTPEARGFCSAAAESSKPAADAAAAAAAAAPPRSSLGTLECRVSEFLIRPSSPLLAPESGAVAEWPLASRGVCDALRGRRPPTAQADG